MKSFFTLPRPLARFTLRPFAMALFALLMAGSVQAVDIVNEPLTSGTIPAGWSQTGVTFTTAATGYASVSSSGILTSPVIDLSGYTGVTLTFTVAKFGTGGDGPLTVEFSNNGGSTWTAQTFTSPTPTGSTYLTSGPTSITVTGSNVQFRFNNASASGKRLRMVKLSGTVALSNTIVAFASASSTIAENAGPVNLAIAITNPDALNATTVTIGATGATGRVSSYNTTVVFAAGSSANENVVVNLNDNTSCDGDQNVVFTITAVTGGSPTAVAGAQATHTLTVTDNETTVDPVATAGTAILSNGFTANWNTVDGATGYFLDVSTSPTFGISSPGTSTTETFTGVGGSPTSSYLTRSWTGVDGVGWTAYKSRIDQVVNTGNAAITLENAASAYLISDAIAGGVSAISFDVKQVFSGTGGILTVKVLSGAGFATSTTIGTIAYDLIGVSNFSETFTAITGPIQILVENNTAARAAIDNLMFTRAADITPSFVAGYDNLSVGTNLFQAVTGLDALTTYYYRVRSAGGCSTGDNSNVIDVTTAAGVSPVLNATVLADFGTLCVGVASAPQSLTLSGVNLTTANVTVAALSGFSYSTTELGTYTSTLSLTQGGGTFSQDIWVMFSPTADQNYNGDITVGGGGAADIGVVVLGNGTAIPSEVSTGAASQSGDDATEAYGSLDVEGCFPTTAYGIEYSTTLGFTTGTGTQVASVNMIGADFSSVLTGLDLCTDYYYRAYITNSEGTFYGAEETFNNTDISAPTATAGTVVSEDGFTANWNAIGAATGYFLDVSTSPTFGTPLSSTTVSTGFDGGRLSLPTGWSHTGLGTDYGSDGGVSAPSLKFDTSGDRLVSPTFAGGATSLSFWYKGQGTVGSASELVTEGYNGTSWVTIGSLGPLASSETGTQTYTLDLNDGYVQFRFTYTKVTGNLAFDDASITYTAGSPDLLPGYDALPVAGTSQVVSGLDPATTYYYRVRANSGCSVGDNSNTIEVTTMDVIGPVTIYYSRSNGTVTDAIWSDTPTGTAGLAIWGTDVSMVVQSGHTVTVDGNININDLTTEANSRLNLNSERLLSVYGSNLTLGNSSMGSSNGVIDLLSQDAVSINITGIVGLNDLSVNTPMGTSVTGTLDIRGTLLLSDGDFDATAGTVRLRSNATRTGHLGPVAATADYLGDLTVQRFIPEGVTNWRLLGSSVDERTVADWNDDFITAGFPGSNYPSFDAPVGSGILWPSVRWYDETNTGTNVNDGLLGVSSMAQELTPGQGFAVWCGDALGGTASFQVDVVGEPTIARSAFALPVTYTSNSAPGTDGWNLVSNPLPSAIDFTTLSRGSDLFDGYYVYDPVTGSTVTWDEDLQISSTTDVLDGTIQSSQAFWLKAAGPSFAASVSESDKVSLNTGGVFGGVADNAAALPIMRLIMAGTTGTWSDQAVLAFVAGTPALDVKDALKLDFSHPSAPRIATRTSDGFDLIVNKYGTEFSNAAIPVTVRVPSNGTYTITVSMSGIEALTCFTLEDLLTGTITPLYDGSVLTFNMNATSNVVADRFVLRTSTAMPYSAAPALCNGTATGQVAVQVSNGPVDLTLADAFGAPLQVVTGVANGEFVFDALMAGNYTVSVGSSSACGTLSGSVLISEPFELASSVDMLESTCGTEDDGRLDVSIQGGVAPYTYEWNDGSTEAFITGVAGLYYTVVIDAMGCSMYVEHDILAGGLPDANFQSSATTVLVNEPVAFTNLSSAGADYIWNFGDGTTSTDQDATHSYALPGVYTVVLTANNGTCDASVSQDINVQITTSVTATPAAFVMNAWSAGDQLIVEHGFDNGKPVLVDVLDAIGRVHMQKQFVGTPGRVSLTANTLSTGIWFVRITSGKVQHTFRVPVIR